MSRVIADGLSDKALALISSSIDADTLDGIDSLGFDAAGAADTAVSDHVALPDPHTQYAEIAGASFSSSIGIGGAVPGGTFDNGNALAVGDSDTGIRQNGDGVLELWANSQQVVTVTTSAANFTTMPQVGGDPIVESGSNADGEFTKWADGTQIVRKHFGSSIGNTNTYTIQGVTFFRKEKSVTYAAAFVSNPTISLSFNQNTEDIFLSNYYASESNTTIDIQFISLFSFSSFSFSSGYLTATGRWK